MKKVSEIKSAVDVHSNLLSELKKPVKLKPVSERNPKVLNDASLSLNPTQPTGVSDSKSIVDAMIKSGTSSLSNSLLLAVNSRRSALEFSDEEDNDENDEDWDS